jgi:outer membrane protein OmpA-like peptidoglycan-associated protein
MRRTILLALLLLPGACAFFSASGQRFVVFFQADAVTLDDTAARQVVVNAAAYALDNPDMLIQVDGFADKNGTPEANAEITRTRVQNVIRGLTSNAVPVTRIARREVGAVPFTLDSQESRRVTIVIGRP